MAWWNGAPIPNWLKLIILGFCLCLVFVGQRDAVTRLADSNAKKTDQQIGAIRDLTESLRAQHMLDSIQVASVRDEVRQVREVLNRRTDQINFELGRISERTGIIMRKVD